MNIKLNEETIQKLESARDDLNENYESIIVRLVKFYHDYPEVEQQRNDFEEKVKELEDYVVELELEINRLREKENQ